jgi:hypothetical protein
LGLTSYEERALPFAVLTPLPFGVAFTHSVTNLSLIVVAIVLVIHALKE